MERAIDQAYLECQYGTTERLRTRLETRQRYSERADDFFDWVLDRLNSQPGDAVLDVGSGAGSYHPSLCARGVLAILGVDASTASYDCAMANHMLFQVPDQGAALRELRRVLEPGGRVVLATTGPHDVSRLRMLHERAAVDLGYTRDR